MTDSLLVRSRPHRSRPVAEALEARTVPALVAEFTQGVLGVWGTDGADEIVLNQKLGRISVADTLIDHNGTMVASVPAWAVRRIDVVAGAGDDGVYLDSHTVAGQQPILKPTRIWGEAGSDVIVGGQGPDTVDSGTGEDEVHGGGGNDSLWGGGAKVWLHGDNGNDVLEAESAQAVLYGGAGNDRLEVWGSTTAWLYGELGNDRLEGDAGADVLDAGAGNDVVFGHAGDDAITGGLGNDRMFGGHGADDLDGGAGTDTMWGGDEAFAETLDDGLDTFRDLFNWTRPVYYGTNIADLRQMGSPTCALLASAGAAINAGFNLAPSFMSLGNNEYAVFLYDAAADDWEGQRVFFDGTWTDLDANVPRTAAGAVLPEFWPVLLQRGYLQFWGLDWSDPAQAEDFRADPADALTALTSWDTRDVAIQNARPGTLWQSLWNGEAVVATTPNRTPGYPGLVQNHAYTVLAMGQLGGEWFVRLRNPWGTDFDSATEPVPEGADDGIISLWWDDFVANFSGYTQSI